MASMLHKQTLFKKQTKKKKNFSLYGHIHFNFQTGYMLVGQLSKNNLKKSFTH
jgi:hypothetical protein